MIDQSFALMHQPKRLIDPSHGGMHHFLEKNDRSKHYFVASWLRHDRSLCNNDASLLQRRSDRSLLWRDASLDLSSDRSKLHFVASSLSHDQLLCNNIVSSF
uniref:Small serum protein 2 n=1 Tax=Jaagichlorella roystonensis TaxID=1052852 RepID=A0A6C0M9H6_9CHLO|nr:small serum protein 2 [Jaagichlorella roystonensis]YP_009733048.1 small serum protein 2 [Jaagichlorella roystonensis]QHU78300.1 small serum protein 2 [Jaagichlorella roystonensis]QHU78344.1 small serum protein 2 [Jaagichlorella roystonensis]